MTNIPDILIGFEPKHQPDLGLDHLPAELLHLLGPPFEVTHYWTSVASYLQFESTFIGMGFT